MVAVEPFGDAYIDEYGVVTWFVADLYDAVRSVFAELPE